MSLRPPGSSASFDSETAPSSVISEIIWQQIPLSEEPFRRVRERYVDHSGGTFLHFAATKWDWPGRYSKNRQRRHKFVGGTHWLDIQDDAWKQVLEDCREKLGSIDRDGRTALSVAAGAGNILAIRLLLSQDPGLFYDDMDKKRKTPLFYLLELRKKIAEEKKDKAILHGDSFKFTDPGSPDALVGHLIWNLREFLKVSFSHDTEYTPLPPCYVSSETLSETDGDGRTLLSRAVEAQDYKFVRILLLVEGIDIKQADLNGEAPLLRALRMEDSKMAHLLANRDPEAFNSLMRTSDRQDEDSLPKLVKMAWDIGILDRESQSAENALRCAVGLKEMSVIRLLLEYGVPPRLFERRKDWLDLMNDKNRTFVELAEMKNPQLDQRQTNIYRLGPVDIAEPDLLRSMRQVTIFHLIKPSTMLTCDRFYRSCKVWKDQDPLAKNKYGKSKVTPGGKTCDISLKFPNPECFFDTQTLAWLGRDMITNPNSNELLRIGWTRSEQNQVFYSSTLSSGQIPKSDDAFILELISEMDFEWSLILTNIEERFSASVSPYQYFFLLERY